MTNEVMEEKIKTHDTRLNDHAKRLDTLEQKDVRLETRIDNLCKQLEGLNTTLKWFIGLLVGSFVAFFFYAIQNNIFK